MAPQLKSYEDALAYCCAQGLRLSQQRRFILELLWSTNEHLTASAIYDRLRQQGKNIGHTSVYQNLDILAKADVIERLEKAEGCLYSHAIASRCHVHCLDNGEVMDVMFTLPPEMIAALEKQIGLQIQDYRIDLFAQHSVETLI